MSQPHEFEARLAMHNSQFQHEIRSDIDRVLAAQDRIESTQARVIDLLTFILQKDSDMSVQVDAAITALSNEFSILSNSITVQFNKVVALIQPDTDAAAEAVKLQGLVSDMQAFDTKISGIANQTLPVTNTQTSPTAGINSTANLPTDTTPVPSGDTTASVAPAASSSATVSSGSATVTGTSGDGSVSPTPAA